MLENFVFCSVSFHQTNKNAVEENRQCCVSMTQQTNGFVEKQKLRYLKLLFNGQGRRMLTEPFEHYCFIVETATELIRRVFLMRPRLQCKCLRASKHTAKPSQRQDSSDRGGKFYLVEFAPQLRLRLIFESGTCQSVPSRLFFVSARLRYISQEILLSRILKIFGFGQQSISIVGCYGFK